MRAIQLALTLLLLTAGCLSGTQGPDRHGPEIQGEPTGEELGEDAFWMVWIDGDEAAEDDEPHYVCSIVFDHEVDREAQVLTYEDDTYTIDPETTRFIIAIDLWEQGSSCPLTYTLHTNTTQLEAKMGAYGPLTLTPGSDGSLDLDGQGTLVAGQTATYTYTGQRNDRTWEGTFAVHHLGPWPTSSLEPR